MGYGRALGSREFRALFAGQAVSIAGTSVAGVALTILVYRRTGSPFLSALTFAFGFLPYVFGGVLLSSVVDRVRPRRLVSSCDLGSGAITAAIAWPGLPTAALLGLLFCVGTLSSVASGARSALVRATVDDDAYVPARSLMKVAGQSAQIGGNALGGVLVVALGPSGAILLDAASFAISGLFVRSLLENHPITGTAAATSLLRDSLAGAREILAHSEPRRLLLLGWLVPMFSVAPEGLAAPYVSGQRGSAALVGVWLVALPLGTILGDAFGVRFLQPARQRRLVAPAAALGFLPYLVFAARPAVPLGIGLLALAGVCGLYSLGLDGRFRDAVPDHLFARAMSLSSAGLMTLQGIGFALAGAVAEGTSSATAIAIAGGCGLVAVALLR